MDDHDKQLLQQLASGNAAKRIAAARSALQSNRAGAAELSHPIIVAMANGYRIRKHDLSWLRIGALMVVLTLASFYFVFSDVGIHAGPVLPMLAMLLLPWLFRSFEENDDANSEPEFPPYEPVAEMPYEAHSLAAINRLAPLLASPQVGVRQDVAKALLPVLPILDADGAGDLRGDTVASLARATEGRDFSIRFRLDLMRALERMADVRAEDGVARTLADCQFDPVMSEAASSALWAIRANKRNSALLRPADVHGADNLLHPTTYGDSDPELLLRPTPRSS